MKKQKIKKILKFPYNILVASVFSLGFSIWILFAVVFTELPISWQTASWTWSYGSKVLIKDEVTNSWAYYVNKGNNSSVIWNYFKWYYFDSLFWYFRLDWSTNLRDNVRIVDSTSKCSTGYWYRLDWKAKWWLSWYIDFWYNKDTFVYYCLNDNKLYGRAYQKYIWFQDFDWIALEVLPNVESLIEKVNSDIFINDDTSINIINSWWKGSNASESSLWWDIFHIKDTRESIFYIIK